MFSYWHASVLTGMFGGFFVGFALNPPNHAETTGAWIAAGCFFVAAAILFAMDYRPDFADDIPWEHFDDEGEG